jgi:hypothetical protein
MGYLNFRDGDERHLSRIRQALRQRGLQMDEIDDWKVHGPHPNMDFQVYVGKAYESLDRTLECSCHEAIATCLKHKDGFYVVICPRAVYAIDDSSDWWKAEPQDRIPVKERD